MIFPIYLRWSIKGHFKKSFRVKNCDLKGTVLSNGMSHVINNIKIYRGRIVEPIILSHTKNNNNLYIYKDSEKNASFT